MIMRRLLELLGILMIGEAIIALIEPRKYLKLWEFGPEPFQKIVSELEDNPEVTRGIAVLELAAGLWLALREVE